MPTFQHIKGFGDLAEIKDAIGYTLAIKKADGTYDEVATRYKRHKIEIPGEIKSNGSYLMYNPQCQKGKSISITPITKLTDNGYVYYLKVSGTMRVEMITSSNEIVPLPDTIYNAPFEGTFYVGSYWPVTFSYENLELKSDGIYLKVKTAAITESIKVYALTNTQNVKSIMFAQDYVTVSGVAGDVRRSDFIPISALTDGLRMDDTTYACFGVLKSNDQYDFLNLAFYKAPADSAFIGGVTYNDILQILGATSKDALTVSDINSIVEEIANVKFGGGQNDAEYANRGNWFVVFSSSINATVTGLDRDVVSVGKVYFPLFENDYDKLKGAGPYNLAVKAIGDGTFFSSSEYSTTVEYTPNFS